MAPCTLEILLGTMVCVLVALLIYVLKRETSAGTLLEVTPETLSKFFKDGIYRVEVLSTEKRLVAFQQMPGKPARVCHFAASIPGVFLENTLVELRTEEEDCGILDLPSRRWVGASPVI